MNNELAQHSANKALQNSKQDLRHSEEQTPDTYPLTGSGEIIHVRDTLARMHRSFADLLLNSNVGTQDEESVALLGGVGTWLVTLPGRQISWSPGLHDIMGQDCETFQPTPHTVLDLVHEDDRLRYVERRRQMHAGSSLHSEFRICRPDGEVRVVRELAHPIQDENGRVTELIGVVLDITEQRNLQQAQLHAEKLRSIGQMTTGIAHDLNNFLTVASLNLETVLEEAALPASVPPLLQPALQAVQRSTDLLSQLLHYGRRHDVRPRLIDLQSIAEALLPLVQRAVGRNLSVGIAARSTDRRIRIDEGQFENVLMNLAINARDAMEAAGRLTIAITEEIIGALVPSNPDPIVPGQYLKVSVADTGRGIPLAQQARIFEPFFTTKPAGRGTGLGLSSMRSFVYGYEGLITLESEFGRGTTISMYFPV
jgi:PAS domain S-box-containing protein